MTTQLREPRKITHTTTTIENGGVSWAVGDFFFLCFILILLYIFRLGHTQWFTTRHHPLPLKAKGEKWGDITCLLFIQIGRRVVKKAKKQYVIFFPFLPFFSLFEIKF